MEILVIGIRSEASSYLIKSIGTLFMRFFARIWLFLYVLYSYKRAQLESLYIWIFVEAHKK